MNTVVNEIMPVRIAGLAKGLQMYDVSYAQRRLWLQEQFEDMGYVYHMPFSYRMENIDEHVLEMAFMALVHRHESFRTTIEQVEGEPRQFIHPVEDFAPWLVYEDLRTCIDVKEVVERITTEMAQAPFDLARGPLVRAKLLRITNTEYLFLVTLHHIICDGYSMQLMEEEFNTFYEMISATGDVNIPPLPMQYKDHAVGQKKRIESGELNKSRTYWLEHLAGTLPSLQLCAEVTRPLKRNYEGSSVHVLLPEELRLNLFTFCQQRKASLFIGVMSIIKILLYRYSEQEDQVLGIVVAGRNQLDLENQIGFYVNTLALRSRILANNSFVEILEQVKDIVFNAQTHQEYPFDLLVNELGGVRDMSRNPVFDIMVNYIVQEPMTRDRIIANDTKEGHIDIQEGGISKQDMSFVFTESKEGLTLAIEYNSTIYPAAWMNRFTRHFINLANALVQAPDMPVAVVPYLELTEKHLLIDGLNNTSYPFDKEATIIGLFQQQVRKNPDRIALQMGEKTYTYKQLDDITGRLATYLITKEEVIPGAIVGIMQARSPWMMISILGILKCGAAYLPIDPEYPEDRIKYMLENAKIERVLTDKPARWPASATASQISINTDLITLLNELEPAPASHLSSAEDLAYVIYTSGSTGLPKGVMITHRSVINFSEWLKELIYADGQPRNCMLTAPISFDASVQQLFPPLIYGSKLIIISDEERKDPHAYARSIVTQQVAVLDCTPGYLEVVLEALAAIKGELPVLTTLIGGEALKKGLVQRYYTVFPKGSRLINVYGLTETTVDSTYEVVLPEEDVPSIGKPVHNTGILILDSRRQLMPLGVAGEIAISGDGVAKGYLYDEQRTGERFIAHPYIDGERLLLTGDQGYRREDGRVMFIGRKDNQIKLRGFRIELGEIEFNIAAQEGVAECCVKVCKNKIIGDFLVAYYSGNLIKESELKARLKEKLPDYMIPSRFVYMDRLPLNANGKVDRRKLPDEDMPEEIIPESSILLPVSDTEIALADIWKEVLGKKQVGVEDNFLEIGGHSLKAMQVITRVYKGLEVELMLKDIFSYPTVATLAAEIDKRKGTQKDKAITKTAAAEYYDVSLTQRRLWLVDQFGKTGHVYNVTSVYGLENVEVAALQQALEFLVNRHEILRTTIQLIQGQPKQRVHNWSDFTDWLTIVDLRQENLTIDELGEKIRQRSAIDQDLSSGPLLRCTLLRTTNQGDLLIVVVHHILIDGWSMDIFKRELLSFYEAFSKGKEPVIPPLSFQYRDFARWQQEKMKSRQLDAARDYWLSQLTGELPVSEFPQDKLRTGIRTFDGESLIAIFPAYLREKLSVLCRNNGATLFMGLVSILKVLLYRYTEQSDILLGTVGNGRDKLELEDKIGLYVNTLVLRTAFQADTAGFLEILGKVKETILGAFQYQDYPFDALVEALGKEWAADKNPLFDIIVDIQTHEENDVPFEENEGNEELRIIRFGKNTSKFDLNFSFYENSKGLALSIIYNSALYSEERITALLRHYIELTTRILSAPEEPIGSLPLIGEEEQSRLSQVAKGNLLPYNTYEAVSTWFEIQTQATPGNIAVYANGHHYTYDQLNRAANKIAWYLKDKSVNGEQEMVVVCIERSFEFIAAVLSVLKAGMVFLPVDPANPDSRINDILVQSGARCMLVNGWKGTLAEGAITLNISEILQNTSTNEENLPAANRLKEAAYVIFTSGSSGQPKGVKVAHQSLMNLCAWHQQEFGIIGESRATVYAGTGFDASIWEIWPYLLKGAGLYVLPLEVQQREDLMRDFLREHKISHMFLPTAAYELLADQQVFGDGLTIFTGGEQLKKVGSGNWKLYNCYGPTEATVVASFTEVEEKDAPIPIGKPIANTRIYILDSRQQLMPYGCKGEIYIGGDGVAIGYLNDHIRTQEKFIADPWYPGQKMYRTGDWGYWNGEGQLVFVGRQDNQVKIRGFRIELEEIEKNMMQVEQVSQAVVVAHKDENGSAYLAGWYTGEISEESMKHLLAQRLPYYMIPFYLEKITAFELTTSGKIDRKSLPVPALITKRLDPNDLPATRTEKILTEIWQRIFGKGIQVGVNDNFFELGGHSIKVMQLINATYQDLDAAISFRDVFTYPNIRSLGHLIDGRLKEKNRADVKLLVKLSDGDADLPSLFCVPAILGSATAYLPLANAIQHQANSFGLFYPGFFMEQDFPQNLPGIAQLLASEIMNIQVKEKPLFLLGYSIGAWISFEMTKLLEANGYTVTLILMDKNVEIPEEGRVYLNKSDVMQEGFLSELSWLNQTFTVEETRHLEAMYKHNSDVHASHTITGMVNADIFAIQGNNPLIKTNMSTWKEYSNGLFSSFDINAIHTEILNTEHLPILSKIMKRILIS
ncbi:amino acid adenylation domain-containing protein [Chitinophaga pendula]|uniref:non-ribosomal peptide synthetase n=1 Tax=Chitinophaga pendula TaxID=2849666 RepID=UPI001CEE0176|nr:non-ribosomal peptide synthetase [Chitinophaga pendula]UCJ08702.1 amino acid adenylation domain-containing protein [Chitinophaga pendula]